MLEHSFDREPQDCAVAILSWNSWFHHSHVAQIERILHLWRDTDSTDAVTDYFLLGCKADGLLINQRICLAPGNPIEPYRTNDLRVAWSFCTHDSQIWEAQMSSVSLKPGRSNGPAATVRFGPFLRQRFTDYIGSMYGIYANIYHQYSPNVSIYIYIHISIYTIHGSYGYRFRMETGQWNHGYQSWNPMNWSLISLAIGKKKGPTHNARLHRHEESGDRNYWAGKAIVNRSVFDT